MPGQPAWTLTEMLECNLPLCWAGGGDCKVGPALICWRPIFFFILKPIRATASRRFLLKKSEEAEKQARRSIFFWSRKEGMLGDFSGAENRACWAFSPWSRKSAAAIFLLQQNSQICMQIG